VAISSTGIGSGLDVESIISAMMSVESRPLNILQTQASGLEKKISAWGNVKSYVSDFQTAVQSLSSVTLWNSVTSSSSNTDAVSVSADDGATVSSHNISVDKLATSQAIASPAFASKSSTLNAGSLTIQLGAWDDSGGFTANAEKSAVTIDIADGSSLSAIRDKINKADAGVTASIVTDANGARLVMRSNETGAVNGFKVTASETSDDGNAATGLSALGYTGTGSPAAMSQSAQNAELTVDGIDISSASNTVTGVIDGLTLTVNQETTSDVVVKVGADTEAISSAIDSFVSSFNKLTSFLKDQTKYIQASETAGPLQGDSSAVGLIWQMRGALNIDFTGSETMNRLSDIGITMQKDGTLKKSSSELDDALGNLKSLKAFFADDGSDTDTASQGIAQRFYNWTKQVLDDEGSIGTRVDGLQTTLDRNEKRQDEMQTRLDQTETRLRKQYEALDTTMANLSQTSGYVSSLLSILG